MAYVSQVPETQANPEVQQLYNQVREHYGFVPNYFQALGRMPSAIAGHLAMGEAVLKDGALPLALKEQMGLVVSGINASSYCVAIHMEVLHNLGVPASLADTLAADFASAPTGEKEKALFRFAEKLTRQPDEIEKRDVDALLSAGWTEDAVLEAVLTVAWFNLINRVSLGLGLVADS